MNKRIEICRNNTIIKYKGVILNAEKGLLKKDIYGLWNLLTWQSPFTFLVVDVNDCCHIFHTDEIKNGSVQIYEVLDD